MGRNFLCFSTLKVLSRQETQTLFSSIQILIAQASLGYWRAWMIPGHGGSAHFQEVCWKWQAEIHLALAAPFLGYLHLGAAANILPI